MDANMQLIINIFRQVFPDKIFFPDISLIFSKIPDISLTAVKFPDISRFSRQVVTRHPASEVTLLFRNLFGTSSGETPGFYATSLNIYTVSRPGLRLAYALGTAQP